VTEAAATQAPSQFSTQVPGWQTAWDSTSLGLLKECPRKYYYQMILGYQPRGLSIHLFFGLCYHSALEHYDHARAAGQDHEAATLAAVRRALTQTWIEQEDGSMGPWESGDSYKNRYTLVRSVVWHCDHFRNLPFRTVILHNNKPAVEYSFRFEAMEIAGESILLCGHMDALVEQQQTGIRYVKDHKTTKNALDAKFFKGFTPHNQFTLYTIAGGVVLGDKCEGVLVSGAQIAVGFTRFQLQPVARPQAILEEWLRDTQYHVAQARHFAETDHWPLNDKACGNYGGCAFQSICKVSPSHRKAHLDADFAKWHWNPLEVRGDI
jgi:hypothetical protein